MIPIQLRKLSKRAVLCVQAVLLCACATQAQPHVSAMNEIATSVPSPSAAVASSTPGAEPTETAIPPTRTLEPSATALLSTPTIEPSASLPATPTLGPTMLLEGVELVEALRAGGYVLYFRHAATDMSQLDSPILNFQDCSNSTQS